MNTKTKPQQMNLQLQDMELKPVTLVQQLNFQLQDLESQLAAVELQGSATASKASELRLRRLTLLRRLETMAAVREAEAASPSEFGKN